MDGVPEARFWGKLAHDASGGVIAWHPLQDHCADVAACCEALLERTLLRRRLAALGGLAELDEVQVARLCVLAALHDVGKVNLGFWRKARPGAGVVAGHVRPLFALLRSHLSERARLLEALGVEELLGWAPEGLLLASFAHHGEPVAIEDPGAIADPALWRVGSGLDPCAEVEALSARARAWFPQAFTSERPLPDAPRLQHAFNGLVTLADWLGSNVDLFPFARSGARDRIELARSAARDAIRAVWLDPAPARTQVHIEPGWFERVFRFPPRGAQSAILELPVPDAGSVVVLEAETGSGKTEAALARFAALFAAGAVDGMYFALPTRTAATQIHSRVVKAVARAFPEAASRPPVVLAVPGYLRVDESDGTREDPRLPPFATLWPDDPGDVLRWRRWAGESAKRYLAGEIVVGTIDQLLLSALRVKHAHLRATSALRHLLVVDEVHASDAYMNRVLEAVLERHVAAGGHALLMSATLGAAARARFAPASPDPPSLEEAERVPYPALTVFGGGREVVSAAGGATRAKRVRVELAAEMADADAVARRALEAVSAGARVVVLRNTVGGAVATQQAVERLAPPGTRLFECAGRAAPHHSRYSREDREQLDQALQRHLGRGVTAPCLVVATQTIQQSLDIDADFLVTDLCPMDVLLQRIGRLHRHDASRPAGFERPTAVVLLPPEADLTGYARSRTGQPAGPHGIGRVYRDLRVLQATWTLLARERELSIPERNRHYVEQTTHPGALREFSGGAWQRHRAWIAGELMAQGGLAEVNGAAWDEPFGARGWPRDRGHIATRLGANDRVALFEPAFTSPFGTRCIALPIPAWMAGGAGEDARPEAVDASEARVTFRFGERSFVYDRWGLRHGSAAAESEDSDG